MLRFRMATLAIVFLIWFLISIPVGIIVGKFISFGSRDPK